MPNAGHDIGIGSRVRAARHRHGWSREALAFHAGISWSAISQLEAGRRRNLRPGTLAALAGALGVTVDYLVSGSAPRAPMLEHRVLLYESDADLMGAAVPFLSEAVDRSEAALAVTTAAHCELLRQQLGGAAGDVEFADQSTWCSTPGGALGRLRAFVEGHLEAGVHWIRILVEPVMAGRPDVELPLWPRYESMLNLVFRSAPLTVLCAHETAALDADILEQVLVAHPHTLSEAGELIASDDYLDPVEFVLAPSAGADTARPTGVNR
jgi:transcriptional regulator with XRE-family HTH domain